MIVGAANAVNFTDGLDGLATVPVMIAAAAFGQRRKMLRQSLKSLGVDPAQLTAAAGIDPARRAETVPVSGFVAMANELANSRAIRTQA